MPIAKEQLTIGFTVVANPGAYVTKDAVKQHGWEKLVDDGPDLGGAKLDSAQPVEAPKKAAAKATP